MSEVTKTIGVFFGGQNPEHDVSIVTGQLIISELKKMGRSVMPVYVAQDGKWHISEHLGSLKFFTKANFADELAKSDFDKYQLDLSVRKKLVFNLPGWRKKQAVIDVAFPAIHGQYGEDGTLQGLFEMLSVPYAGCGVETSALAMNKILTKNIYRAHGIATTEFLAVSAKDWKQDSGAVLKQIRSKLNKAVFVKPARLGSSIGIGKVLDTETDDLQFKLEVALRYDSQAIVENAVENMVDITCAVLCGAEPRASLLQESVFTQDLFDFNDKYLSDGGAQLGRAEKSLVIPASVPADKTKHIQDLSCQIVKIFGASGMVRVDWLYDKNTGECLANEINTLPGTLYHHLWQKSGLRLHEIIQDMLKQAQEESDRKSRLVKTFPSKLLEQAGSIKLMGSKLKM